MQAYHSILVAVDFSEVAGAVLERARGLAEACGARLRVLHVVEYMPPVEVGYDIPLPGDWAVDEQALAGVARERLDPLMDEAGLAELEPVVVVGDARREIVRRAEEHDDDLVVIGSHGRRGIAALLGSTADAVLHRAPCDVLAVRIGDEG